MSIDYTKVFSKILLDDIFLNMFNLLFNENYLKFYKR